MSVKAAKRRFTVEEYHHMVEVGILSEDDRVELIEGEVVEMTPIGSKHAACVDRMNRLFNEKLGEEVIVRVQSPVRMNDDSEPQPDIAILKPSPDFYEESHPMPKDTLLLVEVAETSRDYDREVKIPLYGRHGVPEAWLVDLEEGILEVYSTPMKQGYKKVERYEKGERISLDSVPEVDVAVGELLN